MVQIKVYLPTGLIQAVRLQPNTTVREILLNVGIIDEDLYEVFNTGDTLMPDWDRDMIYYNNWYVEHGYIPEIYVVMKGVKIDVP